MTPVLLITFNRPEHTRKALEALLVQHPETLYIFQDGPREGNADDAERCAMVRETVGKCTAGCDANIITRFSGHNRGCREAVIFAISEVLREHEQVIVVEDDIITSPAFLSFMEKALARYKDEKSVFSISGNSPAPRKFAVPEDYPYDVFASPRLFNWGWATWRDRWEQADWSFAYYDSFKSHPFEQQAFVRGGENLMRMLEEEHDGKSSAWDIQFAFAHFAHHAVSIVPCVSYTYSIGEDGSGTHCLDTSRNEPAVVNTDADPKLLDTIYYDSRIINLLYSSFCAAKRPLWQKACNFMARKLGRKPPFVIKKKVFA